VRTVAQKRLKIFTGSHYPELTEKVCKRLGVELSRTKIHQFANGEIKCQLNESVRGADVFIFQAHNSSVSEAIMEQAILIDAAKRSSAKHITAVCPFFGYARQDRKSSGREPITAKLVVDIFKVAGADRIVSIDLHTGQIQGFFDGPFDHLVAMPVILDHLAKRFGTDVVIVAPDAGRVKLAERYASRMGADLAIVHKSRVRTGAAEALAVIGKVKDKNCVIIDDMIDTAGTMSAAADLLKKKGAKSVAAATTHGVFSNPAFERIKKSGIDELVVADTLPLPPEAKESGVNITVVSVVDLLANTVQAIFEDGSVSAIFEGENQF
jgi:ribose-phosphate pyrophosphokinase